MKTEKAYIDLPPSVSDVSWRGESEGPLEVHITQEICAESVDEFETSFMDAVRSGQSVIPVVINSPGGSLYDALKIVDIVESSPVPVTTIVRGMAMSAAAMIFSCGAQRVVSPHASIMLHSVRSENSGESISALEADVGEARRLQDLMCKLIARNCSRPASFFKNRMERGNVDLYMSPDEALGCGLATHVGHTKLVVTVSVDTALSITPADTAAGGGGKRVRKR